MTLEMTKYCIMHANSNNNAGDAALKCTGMQKKDFQTLERLNF